MRSGTRSRGLARSNGQGSGEVEGASTPKPSPPISRGAGSVATRCRTARRRATDGAGSSTTSSGRALGRRGKTGGTGDRRDQHGPRRSVAVRSGGRRGASRSACGSSNPGRPTATGQGLANALELGEAVEPPRKTSAWRPPPIRRTRKSTRPSATRRPDLARPGATEKTQSAHPAARACSAPRRPSTVGRAALDRPARGARRRGRGIAEAGGRPMARRKHRRALRPARRPGAPRP